jgi:hypothetical protein
MTQSRSPDILERPIWTSCYQGEVDYTVGKPNKNGEAGVKILYRMYHDAMLSETEPDQFWDTNISRLGVILWRYCPWYKDYYHQYPDAEVAAMFTEHPPARFTPDWKVEVNGVWPTLIATQREFTPTSELETTPLLPTDRILWTGTAPEMSKELWFQIIFPELTPFTRGQIIREFREREVAIAPHPVIPDTAYIYQARQGEWQVHLNRTHSRTRFWSRDHWVDSQAEVTRYRTRKDAENCGAF